MKIALICGGPSLERGISLNSARSVLDHLDSDAIKIVPFYLDTKKNAYSISREQLYSNTPSDFDFKLRQAASALSQNQFIRALKDTGIVFPVMHGPFGEDGGIQRFLESHRIPFVGSDSAACKKAFDKYSSNEYIKEKGFFSLPSALLKIYGNDHRRIIREFFKKHNLTSAIVKPASGGSSIGVFSVSSPEEALEKSAYLFRKRIDTRVVIEQCAIGTEFTTIILQNKFGLPVALPPTEIETDYSENQIFDFRKKYLPTKQVAYHSPPRFDDSVIEQVQAQAEQLFAMFGMRDFARFDGWLLSSGEVWFSDFNTVSGMEQNSFLFQQASRSGLTHTDVLRYIVENAASRYGIDFPKMTRNGKGARKPVSVLFGGQTSERQVSLMSGTNVWLKLRNSDKYIPRPYLLDTDGRIWRLPYHLALNHTVEEISQNCKDHARAKARLSMFEKRARLHVGLTATKDADEFFDPQEITIETFMHHSDFVFNALHGGAGEDGTIQSLLEKHKIPFNGPSAEVSKICIDKWQTSEKIRGFELSGVGTIASIREGARRLLSMNTAQIKIFWRETRKKLSARTLVIKPSADGCSSGVVHLYSASDLIAYLHVVSAKSAHAPTGTFRNQENIIEMPQETPEHFILERFVETDKLSVKNNTLKHVKKTGLLEITVAVVEQTGLPAEASAQEGKIHALNPSITISQGDILTIEEKFQGGTGINLTPPPPSIMRPAVVMKIRKRMEKLAGEIGVRGYSRIDAFANIKTGDLLIIEINTLPALTPSTVFYHQSLAEKPPIFPRELLEKLIKNKGY